MVTPNQLRWRPFPIPEDPVDFVRGLFTICGNGRCAGRLCTVFKGVAHVPGQAGSCACGLSTACGNGTCAGRIFILCRKSGRAGSCVRGAFFIVCGNSMCAGRLGILWGTCEAVARACSQVMWYQGLQALGVAWAGTGGAGGAEVVHWCLAASLPLLAAFGLGPCGNADWDFFSEVLCSC